MLYRMECLQYMQNLCHLARSVTPRAFETNESSFGAFHDLVGLLLDPPNRPDSFLKSQESSQGEVGTVALCWGAFGTLLRLRFGMQWCFESTWCSFPLWYGMRCCRSIVFWISAVLVPASPGFLRYLFRLRFGMRWCYGFLRCSFPLCFAL